MCGRREHPAPYRSGGVFDGRPPFFGGEACVFGFGDELLLSGWSVSAEVVAGFLVVVVVAGPAEVGEFGETTRGNGNVVIDLEVAAGLTPQDGAHRVAGLDCGAEMGRDRAPIVGDPGDIDTIDHQTFEDRVGRHPPRNGDGYGSDAFDFTRFAGFGPPAFVGGFGHVDDDHR